MQPSFMLFPPFKATPSNPAAQHRDVVQRLEQLAYIQRVEGSNPSIPTKGQKKYIEMPVSPWSDSTEKIRLTAQNSWDGVHGM